MIALGRRSSLTVLGHRESSGSAVAVAVSVNVVEVSVTVATVVVVAVVAGTHMCVSREFHLVVAFAISKSRTRWRRHTHTCVLYTHTYMHVTLALSPSLSLSVSVCVSYLLSLICRPICKQHQHKDNNELSAQLCLSRAPLPLCVFPLHFSLSLSRPLSSLLLSLSPCSSAYCFYMKSAFGHCKL